MPILQYNGFTKQTVYNSQVVGQNNPSITLNLYNIPITWVPPPNIPSDFVNKSLLDLFANKILEFEYSVNIQITGIQKFDTGSSQPTTQIRLFLNNTRTITKSWTAGSGPQGYCTGTIGHCQYKVNETFPVQSFPQAIDVDVYNANGYTNYPAYNFTLIVTLYLTIIANCTGSNIGNKFCTDYCLTNAKDCLSSYIDYCLPLNSTNPPIADAKNPNSGQCQDFITDYIQNIGPISEFDTPLTDYCKKYVGFGDLFSSKNELDKNLCACHMPKPQYDNFRNELYKLYPGFSSLGLIDQCLLPQCASSDYKSTTTGKVCPLPKCLNIVEFNNQGTFDKSKVIINQNAKGCANIVGPTPSGPPGPTPSGPPPSGPPGPTPSGPPAPPNSKTKFIIIIAVVSFIILIALVILIITYAGKKK